MSDGCKEFMIMYFEEKMIDGVMCFRTRPDGEWREYSIQDLSRRYAEVKSALSDDGWTYCDDRLPDHPGVYFVTLHNGTIGQSAYYVGAFDKDVIAWWPKPTEPAKGRDV